MMTKTPVHYFQSVMTKTLVILGLMAFTLPVTAAEKYAILVGVSKYPNLEPRLQLKGPANDVYLMKQVLQEKAFREKHIQMLIEDVRPPTRQAIFAALKQLTRRVKSDDFVFLYFAGHGSQQPVSPSAKTHLEPDGLDELFLPRNSGHWQNKRGAVKNAITDDELNKLIMALRNKGAFVWVVFDSSYAGTMTSAIENQKIRERKVSPDVLNVPEPADNPVSGVRDLGNTPLEMPLENSNASKARGGYVAFYAAKTTESTPEMLLPADNPKPRYHGLFSYTLATVLAQNDDITYRQAGQLVLQRYAAQNYHRPTPLFEGTLLDAPIFGAKVGQRIPQWRIQRHSNNQLKMAAGQLHGLTKGSILAVLPNAAASEKAVLGYVEITRAATFKSLIKSIAYQGKPALARTEVPKEAYARLVKPNVSLTLRIALPPKPVFETTANALETQARQVLTEISNAKHTFGVDIAWVPADKPADLHLLLQGNKLLLLPPSADLIEIGPQKIIDLNTSQADLREKLVSSIQAIANIISLLRMSQYSPHGPFSEQFSIKVSVERANKYLNFTGDKIRSLREGDVLTFNFKNNSDSAADVTVLFIDNEYSITAMYPAEKGENNRIKAGGSEQIEVELFADTSGIERLVVIAVPAQPNTKRKNFSFLAQPRLPGTNKSSLHNLFFDAGLGVVEKRGSKKIRQRLNQSVVKVFSWQIAPGLTMATRGKLDRRRK